MSNKTFFYIRVSTTQQGRSGLGIEAQARREHVRLRMEMSLSNSTGPLFDRPHPPASKCRLKGCGRRRGYGRDVRFSCGWPMGS
jgi:hypothetical protein